MISLAIILVTMTAAALGLAGVVFALCLNEKAQKEAVAKIEQSSLLRGMFRKAVKAVGGRETR